MCDSQWEGWGESEPGIGCTYSSDPQGQMEPFTQFFLLVYTRRPMYVKARVH